MIYVAGSSAEIDRAEKWHRACLDVGIAVASMWTETIRRVQAERSLPSHEASNPPQATVADRRSWAMPNITQVRASDSLWLLVPALENPSQGAYFEFATAWNANKLTIASGGDQRFVFTALAHILVESDEQAFEVIRLIHAHQR